MSLVLAYNKSAIDEALATNSEDIFSFVPHGGPIPGNWLKHQYPAAPNTTGMTASSTMIAPYPIGHPVFVDRVRLSISATAASNISAVLYNSGPDDRPNQRIFKTTAVSGSTVGSKEWVLPDILLPPGLYWIGAAADTGSPRPVSAPTIHTTYPVASFVSFYTTISLISAPTCYTANSPGPDPWVSTTSNIRAPIVELRASETTLSLGAAYPGSIYPGMVWPSYKI